MTAAKRLRQKINRATAGRHTGADHSRRPDPDHPGKLLPAACMICWPAPKKWDRSLGGKAV